LSHHRTLDGTRCYIAQIAGTEAEAPERLDILAKRQFVSSPASDPVALVRPLKDYHSTGNDFLLVHRKGISLTPRAEAVKNWLIELGGRRAKETTPRSLSFTRAGRTGIDTA
jgi:hypothetical protein